MTSGASQLSGEILCELDCLLANLGHSCCFPEIDGKQSADWTRQFTYKELGR